MGYVEAKPYCSHAHKKTLHRFEKILVFLFSGMLFPLAKEDIVAHYCFERMTCWKDENIE